MDTTTVEPAINTSWVNRKTGAVYRVVDRAVDATNARDGTAVIVYRPDAPGADSSLRFVRERGEFLAKFKPASRANPDQAPTIDLLALRAAASDACTLAIANRLTIGGAVNWTDLRCTEASRNESDQGTVSYSVLISEASPDATALQQAVVTELARRGFSGIDVITEW